MGICIEITSCPATSLVQPSLHHLPFLFRPSLSLPPLSFFFLFHSSSPSGRSQVYFSVRCARSREIATAAEASLLISNCRGPRGGNGEGEVVEEGRVSRILALFSSQRRGKSLLCRESVSSPTATPSCPQPNPFHSVFRPFPPPSSPSSLRFRDEWIEGGNRAEPVSWNNGAGGEPDGGGNDGKMERWRGGHEIGRDPVRTERERERESEERRREDGEGLRCLRDV